MIEDTIEYQVTCDICTVVTEVCVWETDEKPTFCPMCGSEAVGEEIE